MKINFHTLIVTAVVIFLSLFLGMFTPYYKINNDVENTLFTVAGIMFSIGLGLTVVSNTHGVKNKQYIKDIRYNISICQSRFITLFILLTVFYILLAYTDKWNYFFISNHKFSLNIRLSFAITAIYSIIYFILIFHSIQKFNEELEDRINDEITKKG